MVFYGYAPAMGFWLLKLFGHRDVRVLDARRDRGWPPACPAPATVPIARPTGYPLAGPTERPIRADRARGQSAIDDPTVMIVDVRSDLEFRGERFWPSGRHGARRPGRPRSQRR